MSRMKLEGSSGLAHTVSIQYADGETVEVTGGTACMWADRFNENRLEVEWVLPVNTFQVRRKGENPIAVITAAEVAAQGGGTVYAAVGIGSATVMGFGLLLQNGRGLAAVEIWETLSRVRVLASPGAPDEGKVVWV